jgi:hypothetical protein
MSPSWGSTPMQTDWPTISRNVTLTLTLGVYSFTVLQFDIPLKVVNTKGPIVKLFVKHFVLQLRGRVIRWRRKNTPRGLVSRHIFIPKPGKKDCLDLGDRERICPSRSSRLSHDTFRRQDFEGKGKTKTLTVADFNLALSTFPASDFRQTQYRWSVSLWDRTWRYSHNTIWRIANREG